MTATKPTLESAIAALPADVEGLKTLLRQAGVRGKRGGDECLLCPMALYLSGRIGRDVGVGRANAWTVGECPMHELPPSARQFIAAYDAGREPEFAPAEEA